MSFINNPAFETLMQQANLPQHPTLVVGVSGGADSLYLTLILNDWVQRQNGTLIAVTVDHALRPESSAEAKMVHQFLEQKNIPHDILTWTGDKPKTSIEEKAREKRYQLLCTYCQKIHAHALCLAHHQEDQCETFFLRLTKSSGLRGLSAMHFSTVQRNTIILRPLLTTSKQHILQTLTQKHITWIEDRMNYDPMYERVRWRLFQPELSKMGLTPSVLSQSIQRLCRADDALEFFVNQFIQHNIIPEPEGYIRFSQKLFVQCPTEIRIRIINKLLSSISLNNKNISMKSIEKIAIDLPKHSTLNGCQWVICKDNIFIAKELKHLPRPISISKQKWTQWGNYLVYSMQDCTLSCAAPSPRKTNIPYLIQRTFPCVEPKLTLNFINSKEKTQKELEKSFIIDYKNHKKNVYIIYE